MAITDLGTLAYGGGNAANQSSSSTTTFTAVAAGELVVVAVAVDNDSFANPDSTDYSVSSVTFGGNNLLRAESCSADTAAQTTAALSLWYIVVPSAVASGQPITVTYRTPSTSDHSALVAWHFGVTGTVSIQASYRLNVGSAVDPPSMDMTTANASFLRVRAVAGKHIPTIGNPSATVTYTATAGWSGAQAASSAPVTVPDWVDSVFLEVIVWTGTTKASDPSALNPSPHNNVYAVFSENIVTGTLAATEAADAASFTTAAIAGTLEVYEGAVWLTADSTTLTADDDVTRVNSATILRDTASFSGIASERYGTLVATEGTAVATTWNPADKSTIVTLTNGNLTAATNTAFTAGGVRGTAARSSGKLYFEAAFTITSIVDAYIGVTTSAYNLVGNSSGVGAAFVDIFGGAIYVNSGSSSGSLGGVPASGDIFCVALDLTNKRIWFRYKNGLWNNSGTADPATNTGGLDVSALFASAAAYPLAISVHTTLSVTANFGASAFTYAVPSGFTAWTGSAVGDTAVFAGLTGLTGALAATESAQDTAAFVGSSAWLATLAAIEGADTAAFTGLVGRSGTLAATETTADIAAFAGTVAFPAITGVLAATEGAGDTAAFSGSVLSGLVGTLAATEVSDAASFSASAAWTGALAATEARDTCSFACFVGPVVSGTLDAREDYPLLASSGDFLASNAVTKVNDYLGGDTASFAAIAETFGALAVTEAADVFAGDGYVSVPSEKIGTLNAFESGGYGGVEEPTADSTLVTADQTIFTADLDHAGTDIASFAGETANYAVLAATEASDAARFTGELVVVGVLAAAEARDVADFSAVVAAVLGVLAAVEGRDTAYFSTPRWEVVEEGNGLRNEVQRTAWLAGQGGRVTWLENEVEDTSWLQNLEPEVISLKNEVQRIAELGR